MKKAFTLALTCAALLVLAVPAQAIYVSNCPQICTPSCPCSLQCQGPFGPTTCGAAGQTCTPLTVTSEDGIFYSFEQRLAELETGEQVDESSSEPTGDEAVDHNETDHQTEAQQDEAAETAQSASK